MTHRGLTAKDIVSYTLRRKTSPDITLLTTGQARSGSVDLCYVVIRFIRPRGLENLA